MYIHTYILTEVVAGLYLNITLGKYKAVAAAAVYDFVPVPLLSFGLHQ